VGTVATVRTKLIVALALPAALAVTAAGCGR